jgi:predicted dehydrogenase
LYGPRIGFPVSVPDVVSAGSIGRLGVPARPPRVSAASSWWDGRALEAARRGDIAVIGVGIVGCNYGRTVLLPAFRADRRCEVVALAGTDAARTVELAREANVARGFGDWRALVDDRTVAAVAVAVPPDLQPAIARRALDLGKPVFVEKPLAADLAGAQAMLAAARESGQPTMIDFNFPELASWRRAKVILDGGGVGRLRHVVVTWNVENQATRLRLESWKTRSDGGGGLLGNFVCHCFHYLERLCGPITGLGGRVFPLPGREAESSIALALAFASQAGGSLQMSCASFLGSGHRIEFYGDDGTLVLANPTTDYFRGFELTHARRGDTSLQRVAVEDADIDQFPDPRVAPVSRLVRRFIDACEGGGSPSPGFAEGYRVQCLIDAARRAHASGRWIEVAPSSGEQRP